MALVFGPFGLAHGILDFQLAHLAHQLVAPRAQLTCWGLPNHGDMPSAMPNSSMRLFLLVQREVPAPVELHPSGRSPRLMGCNARRRAMIGG
jgi:hypothetical protein